MTSNGITTTKILGMEQYSTFTRKVGGKSKKYTQYDYRHTDGELFTCIKPAPADCSAACDAWIEKKEV